MARPMPCPGRGDKRALAFKACGHDVLLVCNIDLHRRQAGLLRQTVHLALNKIAIQIRCAVPNDPAGRPEPPVRSATTTTRSKLRTVDSRCADRDHAFVLASVGPGLPRMASSEIASKADVASSSKEQRWFLARTRTRNRNALALAA